MAPKSLLLTISFALVSTASQLAAQNPPGEKPMLYQNDRDISYYKDTDQDGYMRERCRLDVYRPADANGFATIVWFHGGGLTEGERFIPEALKGKGVAIVAPGYRLSPKVTAPAYVEDAAAAVAWAFENMPKLGGAPDRIFVSGHSAGGYLALMVALDKHYLVAHGIDANRIAGIAPLSPNTITHFTIRGERGIKSTQPVIDEMAPLFHVRADAPPILITTGDRELELYGRYEENAYFWRMMKLAGHKSTELYELRGLDHGGMLEPSYPLLLNFIGRIKPAP